MLGDRLTGFTAFISSQLADGRIRGSQRGGDLYYTVFGLESTDGLQRGNTNPGNASYCAGLAMGCWTCSSLMLAGVGRCLNQFTSRFRQE